jgi:hypothetical protein
MQFNVAGADINSGEDRLITISAMDRRDAEKRAREKGLFVSSVSPSDLTSALRVADDEPAGKTRPILPRYFGLRFARIVLLFQTFICYIAGTLLLVATIAHLASESHGHWPAPEDVVAVWRHLVAGVGFLAAGALLHGVAEACRAIRDIASRSFEPK